MKRWDRTARKASRLIRKGKAELSDRQLLWMWVILALTLVILTAFLAVSCGRQMTASDAEVPVSVKSRTPLTAGAVSETAYYTDNLNWFGRSNKTVQKGLQYFYRQTGVQPYLYLTNSLGLTDETPTQAALQEYAASLYGTLFRDEGHLLVVLYENSNAADGIVYSLFAGNAAKTVMDEEAVSILKAYWEAAASNSDAYPKGKEDRMFADVFTATARNIMGVKDRTGWVIALAVLLTLMIVIIVRDFRKAWRMRRKLEQEEERAGAEETEPAVKVL